MALCERMNERLYLSIAEEHTQFHIIMDAALVRHLREDLGLLTSIVGSLLDAWRPFGGKLISRLTELSRKLAELQQPLKEAEPSSETATEILAMTKLLFDLKLRVARIPKPPVAPGDAKMKLKNQSHMGIFVAHLSDLPEGRLTLAGLLGDDKRIVSSIGTGIEKNQLIIEGAPPPDSPGFERHMFPKVVVPILHTDYGCTTTLHDMSTTLLQPAFRRVPLDCLAWPVTIERDETTYFVHQEEARTFALETPRSYDGPFGDVTYILAGPHGNVVCSGGPADIITVLVGSRA